MRSPPKTSSLLGLYPEGSRESAAILKQAVPLMMRHQIAPNPVQYALWYTYSQGNSPDLNKRLDKVVADFEIFPPDTALKLFRQPIIHGELEEARAGQQKVIELVDDIEGDVSLNLEGSEAYKESLIFGLEALRDPENDNLPQVLNERQESAQQMHDQQANFLYRLRAAQAEIKRLRIQLDPAHMAAALDHLTKIFNRNAFTLLMDKALKSYYRGLALVMMDIDHFKGFNDQYGHPLGDRVLQHVGQLLRELIPARATAARYGGEEFFA
jgi:diguanylate cyclase